MNLPIKLFSIQLIIGILFFIHRAGQRFQAPANNLSDDGKRKGIEFVKVLAALFERAEARSYILSILLQNFRRKLALQTGLTLDADDDLLAKTAAAKMKVDEKEIRGFFRDCEETVKKGKVSDRKMLELGRRMDSLEKGDRNAGK